VQEFLLANSIPTLLILGYPLTAEYLGGLIWIKNVVDYIEQLKTFDVIKISNFRHQQEKNFTLFSEIFAILKGVLLNPTVAILDTYGEAAIWMWVLLRVLRPKTKIVIVFHHYEPLSVRHRGCSTLLRAYYSLIDIVTKAMLRNSDKIITVSKSSVDQLEKIICVREKNKIVLVGCSNINCTALASNYTKDIDFFCIGRLEKFKGLAEIWKEIKKNSPESKFIMAGRCSAKDRKSLNDLGITHLGIVPDGLKKELFRRSKVFLFPSVYEGYGMAVGEAVSAKMIVVAWMIPVFKERFQCRAFGKISLIEVGNVKLFAQMALKAKTDYITASQFPVMENNYGKAESWEEVGRLVVGALANLN
jgi:glycosyltransferase involved in cell wall biosynthesis